MLTIITIGTILIVLSFIFNEEITIEEFFILIVTMIGTAFITYGITWLCTLGNNDIYFQSGRLSRVSYHPYFVEKYEEMHIDTYPCGTDSKGYTQYCTRTYYTTEYDKHHEYWLSEDTLGQSCKISKSTYEEIAKEFGGNLKIRSDRIRFNHSDGRRVKGDSNLYYYLNETNSYRYPTNKVSKWHNPLKKTKSLFNTEKELLPYPKSLTWRKSNRNLTWEGLTQHQWDVFNTRVYERIKANVILIKTSSVKESKDIKYAWNSGKKNDIVITYTGTMKHPTNVQVFGWYKTELLSSTLETFILSHGITENSLKGIEHIIYSYYEPFDFEEFNYLKKPPEIWQIIVTSIVTLLVILFLYSDFSTNLDRR